MSNRRRGPFGGSSTLSPSIRQLIRQPGAGTPQQRSDTARAAAAVRRAAALAIVRGPKPNLRVPKMAAAMSQVPRGFTGAAGEAKYVDYPTTAGTTNTYALDTTGSISHISIVPQGTTVNTRVGRKCEIKYIQIRGEMRPNSTATHNSVAVYLVWDEQPNKALAAITDVLDGATSYALSKRENVQRFKILKKWTQVLMGNSGAAMVSNGIVRLDEYIRLPKGLVVVPTTADTTGVIGDIITGALLLVTVGDQAAGTAAAVMEAAIRVGFSDIY